ncbi:MAG: type VI secretion system Vgr family protein, partial [Pseudomonas sp.]
MPRQSEYRFSIDLPNGPACDVVRFRLFEALSQPFRLELDLASAQDNADPIALLDQPAIFTIARHGEPVRQVHGIVTAFDQGDTGFRRTRYQAVVEPSLVRLNLRHNSRIFQRNGVPDIIGTLLKEQRVLSRFDLPRAKHHLEREYCVQHREQDLQFFQRLAGEEGLVYYFDADEQSKLVLSDALFITAPSLARVANAPGTVTYQPNPGGDAGPCLWRFTYRQKMAFTHVTQRDYLFKNPPVRLETRSSAVDAVGHYEHYSYPGRYKDSNAGDRFTQTLTNALRNEATLAELEGDDARLWPGLGFVLDGRPNSSMQKDWRVASLHHEGEQSSSLEEESSGAEHGSRYRYTGTAVPGRADWKPEPCARPVMAGPQIAPVVGPPNEEIHTDDHGRVMVWFP